MSLSCEYCKRQFNRREHLDRHLQRHLGLKPFACRFCGKRFSRRDSLKRHVSLHGPGAKEGFLVLQDSTKACMNCAKAKQRCKGHVPCERCAQKNLRCDYAISVENGRDQNHELSNTSSTSTNLPNHGLSIESPTASRSQSHVVLSPETVSAGFTPTTWSNLPHLVEIDHLEQLSAVQDTYTQLPGIPTGTNTNWLGFNYFWPIDPLYTPKLTSDVEQFPAHLEQQLSSGTSTNSSAPLVSNPTAIGQEILRTSSPCQLFPDPQTTDIDTIRAENYYHVQPVSEATYQQLVNEQKIRDPNLSNFPSLEFFNTFIQLYFEHFHQHFPLLHLPTFDTNSVSNILLLAVAAVGCRHSMISAQQKWSATFDTLLKQNILVQISHLSSRQDLALIQSVLLHNVCTMFAGALPAILDQQYFRNMLITMCRPFLSRQGRFFRRVDTQASASPGTSWLSWIRLESERRLVCLTWMLECFQEIFLGLPPILSVHELEQGLPCSETLWGCSNAQDWSTMLKMHHSPDRSLQSLFCENPVSQETLQSLTDMSRIIVLVTLWIEEQKAAKLSTSWVLQRAATFHEQNGLQCLVLDKEFRALDLGSFSTTHGSLQRFEQKLYNLLGVLRFASVEQLHDSSGFQVDNTTATEARESLHIRLRQNDKQSREAMLQAAKLFNTIRQEPIGGPCDALCLLIATLFMFEYQLMLDDPPNSYHNNNEEPLDARPFRIDQPLGKSDEESWISGTTRANAHLTGVGLLTGKESGLRLLRETKRIMGSKVAWKNINVGIAKGLSDHLSGRNPHL